MAEIRFGYTALKPITAEHPPGSGIEVTYQPGDIVPAGEWKGAAVNALVENGKIARWANNSYQPGEFGDIGRSSSSDAVFFPDAIGEVEVPVPGEFENERWHWDGSGWRMKPTPDFDGPDDEGEPDDGADEAPSGEYPRRLKGGFYELSDGSRVRGKQAGEEAQAALVGASV